VHNATVANTQEKTGIVRHCCCCCWWLIRRREPRQHDEPLAISLINWKIVSWYYNSDVDKNTCVLLGRRRRSDCDMKNRDYWNALGSPIWMKNLTILEKPVPKVFIHQTNTHRCTKNAPSNDASSCPRAVRALQLDDIKRSIEYAVLFNVLYTSIFTTVTLCGRVVTQCTLRS